MELLDRYKLALKAYYQTGNPVMSDKDFDQLEDLLLRYGINVAKVKREYAMEHDSSRKIPMLSLTKVKDPSWIRSFMRKYETIIEPKYDGLAAELVYKGGCFDKAFTRGGEDITELAKMIPNVPLEMPFDITSVRGELVIKKSTELPSNYSNRRNAASGIANTKSVSKDKAELLTFMPYAYITPRSSQPEPAFDIGDLKVHLLKMKTDVSLDFSLDSLKDHFSFVDVETDGIVVKVADQKTREELGYDGNFNWEFAYKFEDEEYGTKLTDISWQVSSNGKVTPVAIFDTVEIDGAKISRASLSSYSNMRKLGLKIGDTVYVKRANMVIPYITRSDRDGMLEIEIPELEVDGKVKVPYEDGAHLFVNRRMYDNPVATIRHQIGILGVKNIMRSKIEASAINGAYDLFSFIEHLDKNGDEFNFNKIADKLEETKTIGEWLLALNLEGVGNSKVKAIDNHCSEAGWRALLPDAVENSKLTPKVKKSLITNSDIVEDFFEKLEKKGLIS